MTIIIVAPLDSWIDHRDREKRLKIARLRASSYRIDDYDSVMGTNSEAKK